jgi:hypothetical protein
MGLDLDKAAPEGDGAPEDVEISPAAIAAGARALCEALPEAFP